ncbi:MAG: hypothetical protein ACTHMM_08880 [Agriterribacter sp.]
MKQLILAWLLLGLYQANSTDADRYLDDFDISQLKKRQQVRFFEQLINISPLHPLFDTSVLQDTVPFLENEVIDDGVNYQLKRKFRELLSFLKVLFYFAPDQYDVYRVRISALPEYPGKLYYGIAACAHLWAKIKKGDAPTDKINILKQIIDDLTIPAGTAQQIDSGHGARAFIKYRIYEVFSQVFDCFADCCSSSEVKRIVDYWIVRHNQSGYPDYNSDLVFAKAILPREELRDEVYSIIQHAEDIARGDHGTTTLVESLSAIGAMYGKARRMQDYNRIYNELLAIACGVSYRKDYQFTNIFSTLEKTHKNNPGATLQRLADNYALLYKIRDAGNARMFHICMAELIGFAADRYPELGFMLLTQEDHNLGRDEAMQIVLTNLLRECPSEQLPFLWLVIITMGKWEHLNSDYDDYINNLYKLFFERMIAYANEKLVEVSYQHVWHQLSVERGQSHKIIVINTILKQRVPVPAFLIYPTPVDKVQQSTGFLPERKERPLTFQKNTSPPDKATLEGMDVDQLKEVVKKGADALYYNRTRSVWHDCWKRLVSILSPWFEGLSDEQKATVKLKFVQIRRKTIAALDELGGTVAADARTFATVGIKLIQDIDVDFPGYELLPILQADNQLIEIPRKVFSGIHYPYDEKQVTINASQFLELMQAAPVSVLGQWASLAEGYYDNPTLVQVYLQLSKRIFAYDPTQSAIYLEKAFALAYTVGYQREDWEDELIVWAYTCTPQKANYYLLYSFYNWHIDREYDIPHKIYKKLLPWISKFNEPEFYEIYYQANYAFNKKLGEGLPEPGVDPAIISTHIETKSFPNIILNYLADLCDYPVVKIRQLAQDALLLFYQMDAAIVEHFIINDLKNRSVNQQEHFIALLQAIALQGGQLSTLVNQLGWMLQTGHFNIQQGFADLIEYIVQKGESVEGSLYTTARNIHKKPIFSIQPLITPVHEGSDFCYSDYQNRLLEKLTEAGRSETRFDDELYTELINKGWNRRTAWSNEAAVHRHYNINSNFDRLEINGPLFANLQELINRRFFKWVRQGAYQDNDILKLKYDLRLYDPGVVGRKMEAMPANIQWKGFEVTEDQFMAFADVDEVITNFVSRDQHRISIFENGNHRVSEYPAQFTQYFTASLFMGSPGMPIQQLTELLTNRYPYYHVRNFYRSEMERCFADVDSALKIHGLIQPLLAVSDNLFRDREDGCIAIVLPELYDSFGHTATYIEWQEPFKDDRRRFEPNSKGSTVTIDRDALKSHATKANLSIYLCFDLHRTTEKYKSEADMNWENRIVVRELAL